MLGPVVLAVSLFAGKLRSPSTSGKSNRRPRLDELVPWFILGFLAVLLIRSFDLIPPRILPATTATAAILTTIAMAGLGLGVDVGVVARTGLRVTLAVTVSLIALGLMSYGLIRLLAIG
jgi:uncharacterized membrane protein YadS